jgi:hypothetical protein
MKPHTINDSRSKDIEFLLFMGRCDKTKGFVKGRRRRETTRQKDKQWNGTKLTERQKSRIEHTELYGIWYRDQTRCCAQSFLLFGLFNIHITRL